MGLSNRDIMLQSRDALRGKWGLAIGGFLLYFALALAVGFDPYTAGLAGLILSGPLAAGQSAFFLKFIRGGDPVIEDIFTGFWNFKNALLAYLWMFIFLFLWTLLLIVPGIVAAFSYSQTFYLIADDSELTGMAALRLSKAMMIGYKWKLVCLGFRFFGWFLLGCATLGIGFIWIGPLFFAALAKFHEDVKGEYEASRVKISDA